eukprot:TRINITY_DN21297_c0_g1_i1.p1 TRINITY_DN21297_c0_g1~~TRINITY_DN21297_c0_g1_i1.p1  ORF type:complete len:106 (+),score=7.40 TRINITY_DN21297_c0_g1_i1:126-443(+)
MCIRDSFYHTPPRILKNILRGYWYTLVVGEHGNALVNPLCSIEAVGVDGARCVMCVGRQCVVRLLCVWAGTVRILSLIHISEPTRLLSISYAVFCLKKNNIHINS